MPVNARYPDFSDANIKGAFFGAFEDAMAASYLPSIATKVDSDRAYELYAWLGTTPVMREWKGGRQKNQPNEFDWTIYNKKYESSIGLSVDDIRRDKFGQFDIYSASLGQRAAENPILILSNLLINGAASPCFDGQYFYSTTHVEGLSGTQSNLLTVTLSTLPVITHGADVNNPSDEEVEKVILKMVKQFYSMKDDQAQPVNQTAKTFDLVAPINLIDQVLAATKNRIMTGGRQNTLMATDYSITPYFDARLTATNELHMFRTDHPVKGIIHQVEVDNQITSITDPNSEYVTLNDEYFFGVKRIEAVGYGDYKKAVKAVFA